MPRSFSGIAATLIGWLATGAYAWADLAPVPEIDATGALTGIAVLAGMLALAAERKRQK